MINQYPNIIDVVARDVVNGINNVAGVFSSKPMVNISPMLGNCTRFLIDGSGCNQDGSDAIQALKIEDIYKKKLKTQKRGVAVSWKLIILMKLRDAGQDVE